jgi:predicted amidophosphoribosyltransferase
MTTIQSPSMAVVKSNPMKLPGPWTEGYVVERQHTLNSAFLGHDSFGNAQFDTQRSELGELVFQLKNRGDKSTVGSIADTAVEFVKGWAPAIDLVVPIPPSRKRARQPVVEIARAIGLRLEKPVSDVAVRKIKETPELKGVFDYGRRTQLLEGAFEADASVIAGKDILLIDDLYRSGATAMIVSKTLLSAGAKSVRMLAMTKTRTRT